MNTEPNKKGPSEKSRTTEPQEEFISPEATPSVPMTPGSAIDQEIRPESRAPKKPGDAYPSETDTILH